MSGAIGFVVVDCFNLLIVYCIFIPVIIYYLHRFYQYKCHPVMSKRDYKFVICLNVSMILILAFERPLKSFAYWNIITLPDWIRESITNTVYITMGCLLVAKSYVLFFDQRYQRSIQDIAWMQDIDDSYNDWFVRNHHTWGKLSYFSKRVIIPFWLLGIINRPLQQLIPLGSAQGLVYVLTLIIGIMLPFVLLLVFVCKIRKFHDSFGLRNEIVWQCYMPIITTLGYAVIMVIVGIVIESEKTVANVNHFVGQTTTSPGLFCLCLLSTYYPLRLVQIMQHKQMEIGSNSAVALGSSSELYDRSAVITEQYMLDTFNNKDLFSLFMQHLMKEFCSENLLFVIELLQIKQNYQTNNRNLVQISKQFAHSSGFKEEITESVVSDVAESDFYVLDLNDNTNSANDEMVDSDNNDGETTFIVYGTKMYFVKLPSDLPKSKILKTFKNDIRSQMSLLYEKYMRIGSNYELNLSHSQRLEIEKVIIKFDGLKSDEKDDLFEGDLFLAFDAICLTILGLIISPFRRFRESTEFEEFMRDDHENANEKIKQFELININKDKPLFFDGNEFAQVCEKYYNSH